MYEIIFYHPVNRKSGIEELLDELGEQAKTSKTAQINRTKILAYLNVLATQGTSVGSPIVKHIEGGIWELRPMRNRIFFFHWKDNKFVLLHHFVKKSQKTPSREIEKAHKNLKEFIERSGEK